MEDILLAMGISVLLNAVKDPNKKAKIRKQMLKVFNAIKAAFSGDPDFNCN
jgi:hypothetical protein